MDADAGRVRTALRLQAVAARVQHNDEDPRIPTVTGT